MKTLTEMYSLGYQKRLALHKKIYPDNNLLVSNIELVVPVQTSEYEDPLAKEAIQKTIPFSSFVIYDYGKPVQRDEQNEVLLGEWSLRDAWGYSEFYNTSANQNHGINGGQSLRAEETSPDLERLSKEICPVGSTSTRIRVESYRLFDSSPLEVRIHLATPKTERLIKDDRGVVFFKTTESGRPFYATRSVITHPDKLIALYQQGGFATSSIVYQATVDNGGHRIVPFTNKGNPKGHPQLEYSIDTAPIVELSKPTIIKLNTIAEEIASHVLNGRPPKQILMTGLPDDPLIHSLAYDHICLTLTNLRYFDTHGRLPGFSSSPYAFKTASYMLDTTNIFIANPHEPQAVPINGINVDMFDFSQ